MTDAVNTGCVSAAEFTDIVTGKCCCVWTRLYTNLPQSPKVLTTSLKQNVKTTFEIVLLFWSSLLRPEQDVRSHRSQLFQTANTKAERTTVGSYLQEKREKKRKKENTGSIHFHNRLNSFFFFFLFFVLIFSFICPEVSGLHSSLLAIHKSVISSVKHLSNN